MADRKKQLDQTSEPAVSQKAEGPNVVHSLIVVITALLVVAVVTLGVFYFTVKNNINGMADILLPQIIDHPILRLALPEELIPGEPEDPDNPKYLTEKQLLKKYDEYRTKVKELNESLANANATIEQMKNEAQSAVDESALLKQNEELLKKIAEEQAKVDADKKALSELIARGDMQGFKDYFQKVDKATAEAIYKEILAQDAKKASNSDIAKQFSEMEPENAALVLTELFGTDKETLLNIFEGLKAAAAALILEQMDTKTAAEITKLLSDRKAGI
jgi:flagellar motility protein MotE (MotC chaperone)